MKVYQPNKKKRAYTLIETLVASAVIMVAIGAASSLSLAMVTQEEMSERTVRATNYLENVATLYQLGMNTSEILALLPTEPTVTNLTFTPKTVSITGLGNVDMVDIAMTYLPSNSKGINATSTKSWTGGNNDITRSHLVEVMRSNP